MNPEIQRACDVVKKGGLLAYPTEAVYGLGCDAKNEYALARLRETKQRSPEKGFIVLVSSSAQLLSAFPEIKLEEQQLAKLSEHRSHPTTFIIPVAKSLSKNLVGQYDSLAVRIPMHDVALELCQLIGPLVSTSANLAGAKPENINVSD